MALKHRTERSCGICFWIAIFTLQKSEELCRQRFGVLFLNFVPKKWDRRKIVILEGIRISIVLNIILGTHKESLYLRGTRTIQRNPNSVCIVKTQCHKSSQFSIDLDETSVASTSRSEFVHTSLLQCIYINRIYIKVEMCAQIFL